MLSKAEQEKLAQLRDELRELELEAQGLDGEIATLREVRRKLARQIEQVSDAIVEIEKLEADPSLDQGIG